MANNGWHLWGEYGGGIGAVWGWIGLAVLAYLVWATWDGA